MRLVIRASSVADFEAMHTVWSDPEVMGLIPSQAYDREKSWARLSEKISHQARHGFSKWAVVEKASETVIGECGLHYLEGGPDIELGYRFARARWGRGLAAEAARACLDWALAERRERVVAAHGLWRRLRYCRAVSWPRRGRLCRSPTCDRSGKMCLLASYRSCREREPSGC